MFRFLDTKKQAESSGRRIQNKVVLIIRTTQDVKLVGSSRKK